MESKKIKFLVVFGILLLGSGLLFQSVSAQSVPDWIKNTSLWYGQGKISETEFLNAIKYLIDNEIIVIEGLEKADVDIADNQPMLSTIIIPNGNAKIEHTGFYIPLNLEVQKGTTVSWLNEDTAPHTVQSIDNTGEVTDLFNSAPLPTGEKFSYKFSEEGIFNYYCSLHPWRVGSVTVR